MRYDSELRYRGWVTDPECVRCPLHETARHVCIPGEGKPGGILFVGENPGEEENLHGRPFIGRSGQYLRLKINSIIRGVDVPVYITNAIRCRSTHDDQKPLAIAPCNIYLENEIRKVRPSVIVALGKTAVQALLGASISIVSCRGGIGYYRDWDRSIPVVLTLHPAAVGRMPAYEGWFLRDIKMAVALARGTLPIRFETPWQETIVQEVDDADTAFRVIAEAMQAPVVGVDTETHGKLHTDSLKILCAALCYEPDKAWVFTEEVMADRGAQLAMGALFHRKEGIVALHSAKYDAHVLLKDDIRSHPLPHKSVFDTLGAWRLLRLAQGIESGLETLAWHVGMGGYYECWWKPIFTATKKKYRCKDSEAFRLAPRRALHKYCARDTISSFRGYHALRTAAEKIPAWKRFYLPAASVAASLEAEGVPINQKAIERSRGRFNLLIQVATARICKHKDVVRFQKRLAKSFNPGSNQQVASFLFEFLKLKPTKKTKSKTAWSVDDEVLVSLAGHHPVIVHLQRLRSLKKLQSSYVKALARAVRPDGKLHASYNPYGTATGRWSAGGDKEDRFNLQTIPSADTDEGKLIRAIFEAPPGYKFVEVDLGQIELRLAAILSGDQAMINAFRSGKDFHNQTAAAARSFVEGRKVSPEEITPEERRPSKVINFGVLYGQGDEALAAGAQISVEQAKRLKTIIFGLYRGLKKWIDTRTREIIQTYHASIMWDGQVAMRRFVPEVSSSGNVERSHALRISINAPIQGSASLYTVATLIAMHKLLRPPLRSRMVMTTHDSIHYLCPDAEIEHVAKLAQKIATSWPSGDVPLTADVKVGQNLATLEKTKFKEDTHDTYG